MRGIVCQVVFILETDRPEPDYRPSSKPYGLQQPHPPSNEGSQSESRNQAVLVHYTHQVRKSALLPTVVSSNKDARSSRLCELSFVVNVIKKLKDDMVANCCDVHMVMLSKFCYSAGLTIFFLGATTGSSTISSVDAAVGV